MRQPCIKARTKILVLTYVAGATRIHVIWRPTCCNTVSMDLLREYSTHGRTSDYISYSYRQLDQYCPNNNNKLQVKYNFVIMNLFSRQIYGSVIYKVNCEYVSFDGELIFYKIYYTLLATLTAFRERFSFHQNGKLFWTIWSFELLHR